MWEVWIGSLYAMVDLWGSRCIDATAPLASAAERSHRGSTAELFHSASASQGIKRRTSLLGIDEVLQWEQRRRLLVPADQQNVSARNESIHCQWAALI